MPLYEYTCNTCHNEFEIRRSFSDEGVPACPSCNGTGDVQRKFSAPTIVFKGSGFYVTDSRGKNSSSTPAEKKDAKAEKGGGEAKSTKSEAKTETASAKKSEKKTEKKS